MEGVETSTHNPGGPSVTQCGHGNEESVPGQSKKVASFDPGPSDWDHTGHRQ